MRLLVKEIRLEGGIRVWRNGVGQYELARARAGNFWQIAD